MRITWSLIFFFPIISLAGVQNISTQRSIFTATVVASACHVRGDADGVGNNGLTLGTFRKFTGIPVSPRTFTVSLFEHGATLPGCSAFLTGHVAMLQFGNPGQLDAGGVITQGDGVRIDVQATDPQADYHGHLTDTVSVH